MSAATDVKTPEPTKSRSVRHLPRSRAVEIVGASIVAIGAVVVARAAFGVGSVVLSVIIGYLTFVATVAVVELLGGPEAHVDLVAAEAAEAAERAQLERPLRTVPDLPSDPNDDVPVRRKRFNRDAFTDGVVAAIGAAGFVELLRIVLHIQSTMGFFVWWYLAFIGLYFVLSRDRTNAEAAVDRIATVFVWSVGVAVASVLVWMVTFVLVKGLKSLSWTFFTEDLSKVGPLDSGGGAKHAIIGTLEQVGLATLVVVPIGILTAVYLHEINGRLARPVRFIVDAMAGLPSIVAGLLVYTVWVAQYGYSGIAGAFALAILMLPTMTRASEEILRTVPDPLREGALALGAPQWRLVRSVVLPTALTGIVTASLLAIARAIGETAPLLLTAFGSPSTNTNPAEGPQSALPLFVYSLIRLPNKAQNDRAWSGALVLIMLVFVLFVTARYVSNRGRRKLEGRR